MCEEGWIVVGVGGLASYGEEGAVGQGRRGVGGGGRGVGRGVERGEEEGLERSCRMVCTLHGGWMVGVWL